MIEMLLKGSLYWAGMLAGWSLHIKGWHWIPCFVLAFIWYYLAQRKLRVA